MCIVFKQLDSIRTEVVKLHNLGYHAESLALDAVLNKIETSISNTILGNVFKGKLLESKEG